LLFSDGTNIFVAQMEQVLKQLDQIVDVLVGKFLVVPIADTFKSLGNHFRGHAGELNGT